MRLSLPNDNAGLGANDNTSLAALLRLLGNSERGTDLVVYLLGTLDVSMVFSSN